MKKLITLLLMVLVGISMSAQSYSSLWKQVEKASQNDLPKTALEALHKIEAKALKDENYGQYLAAMMSDYEASREVSRDSAVVSANRLMEWEKSMRPASNDLGTYSDKDRKNAIASLVCRMLLNQEGSYMTDRQDYYLTYMIRTDLDRYVADDNMRALLMKKDATLAFTPIVKREKNSSYFNHDLLSLLCFKMDRYDILATQYALQGNRKAACIASAMLIGSKTSYYNSSENEKALQMADSCIALYQDLQECGALAVVKHTIMGKLSRFKVADEIAWIDEAVSKWGEWPEMPELINSRRTNTYPKVSMMMKKRQETTENDIKIYMTDVRNVTQVAVTVTPIIGASSSELNVMAKYGVTQDTKKYLNTAGQKTFIQRYDYRSDYEEYTRYRDTVNVGKLPLGTYLVEATPTPDKRASYIKSMDAQRTILHISDLKVMGIRLPKDKTKHIVVNANTGHPVPGAKLHIWKGKDQEFVHFDTDDKGECIVNDRDLSSRVYATTDTDKSMRDVSCDLSSYYCASSDPMKMRVEIYTDRSLYRPGQKVQVSAVCYSVENDKETRVYPNANVTVELRNPRYKVVNQVTLKTDEYGMASTVFDLPTDGMNGNYSITCADEHIYFQVAEYVRPTFEVTIDKPTVPYIAGDTVTVVGKAKAYSGAPIADAQVVYTVRRHNTWWWHSYAYDKTLYNDTVTTAADGTFEVKMPVILPEEAKHNIYKRPCFYDITAEAIVTNIAGETHSGELSIPISNRESILTADIKDKYVGDNGIKMLITRRNASGKEIDGKINILIDNIPEITVDANKEFTMPNDIYSGKHRMTAICDRDTLEADIVVFRMADKKPAFKTHDWFYQDATVFPEDGSGAGIQLGSSDEDLYVAYVITSGQKVLESGAERISNSNLTRYFTYKPEYGDGITIAYAWTKDNQTYTHEAQIRYNLPSKKLDMKWKTFRNKLMPGQKEQWQLTVKPAKPADVKDTDWHAMVTATMYDKSLDAISSHNWFFREVRRLHLPYMSWGSTKYDGTSITIYAKYDQLTLKQLAYSTFDHRYIDYDFFDPDKDQIKSGRIMIGYGGRARSNTDELLMAKAGEPLLMREVATDDAKMEQEVLKSSVGEENESGTKPTVTPRSDFSETAFFMPQLLTDRNGTATLSFTLPESVTTWRFMAFAHDKDMRYGFLRDEAVAQKQMMVQPRMPRFLRIGDKATLSTLVSNLSDKDINATVKMTLLDARTEKETMHIYNKVLLKAGQSQSVTFPIDVNANSNIFTKGTKDGHDLICIITAESNNFSDGEQHLLPILSDKELVTDTRTYILTEPKDTVINLTTMIPAPVAGCNTADVKVEYTANPSYLMLEALPSIATPDGDNAINLSSALYANVLASALSDTTYYDTQKLVGKLLLLQLSDGSFSWWKGMSGSSYMTLAVVKTLARMEALTGKHKGVEAMLRNAIAFLDKDVAKDVKEMRKEKDGDYVSGYHLDYLYSIALYKQIHEGEVSLNSDQKYLLARLETYMKHADMQSKAMAAVVFHMTGKDKEARKFVESIKEHTVYRDDIGRYFDSYRTRYSWCDYRIPSHCMAIEAVKAVTPNDRRTIGDMQRWLLSSKRTQQWDNPYNTVNAVHVFFDRGTQTENNATVTTVRKDGLGKETVCDTTVARGKDFSVMVKAKVSEVTKMAWTESWASAYATYLQPASEVAELSTGISVKREVLKSGNLKVGDKVKVRITVVADRDYDFVTVTDNRAACLEPTQQLSGYRYGYYQEMKDKCAIFHFNKMNKGTHTIETEYYVEREGEYNSGTVTAVCTYASEFRGTAKSYKLNTIKR